MCRIIASDRRVARLERLDDLMTRIGQPLAQQLDLSGLAHPVTALEDDEDPARTVLTRRASSWSWPTRRRIPAGRAVLGGTRSKSRPAANAWTGSQLGYLLGP